MRSSFASDSADPLQGRPQVLARVGVAEAEIPLTVNTEGGAGETAHAGVVEQVIGDLGARAAEGRHVRECVEGAVGHPTGDPRNGVQPVHHQGAARDELAAIGIGLFLRPGERLDGAVLRERVRARHAVDHQAAERRDEPLRQHAVAHAPSGHREGLAEAVQRDRSLRHAGQGRDAERLALVLQAAVDLVGEHHEIVLHGELGEPRIPRRVRRIRSDCAAS